MCGLTGVFESSGATALGEVVSRMGQRLRHRGPDSNGLWSDPRGGIAISHQRLAVVDLTAAGAQPMLSRSGRWVIAFNGEIYNHAELRRTLPSAEWRGTSDTETLVAMIEQFGVARAIELTVGMFAIAAWDREKRELHLARDRIGEKPLYYGWADRSFVFGSELKALREYPGWSNEINRDALCLYFRYSYIPAPFTIYKNVWKLPPGTSLVIREQDLLNHELDSPVPYWSLLAWAERGARATPVSESDAVHGLEQLLAEAVNLQRLADVPLGVFLSGGIDSSLIAAIMQEQSRAPIRSFTIGFHEKDYDESRYARSIAQVLGTEHTELILTSDQAQKVIPQLPEIFDEPFADSSQIPTLLVSKIARSSVTVALSGDGGDELFGGYNRYFLARGIRRRLMRLPLPIRGFIANLILRCPPHILNAGLRPIGKVFADFDVTLPSEKAYKAADILSVAEDQTAYRRLVSHWQRPEDVVVNGTEPSTLLDHLTKDKQFAASHEQWMMTVDSLTYLPEDILVKVDRASMAVGLEARAPFLDHRLVQFSLGLPLEMKLRDGKGKWLLREALFKRVPSKLFDRPKMGFALPIDSWLRGPLRSWAEDLLDPSFVESQGLLRSAPITEKWNEHKSGRRNWQGHLWDVLMFQAWYKASQSQTR